jgi:hypothetical protein
VKIMPIKLNYIIFAPDYDENSGGIIALHKLCHHLNECGESASLWPSIWVRRQSQGWWKRFRRNFKEAIFGVEFDRHPDLITPIAKRRKPGANDVVVYPEVVAGNPLGGINVVRWLLHRPGFHTSVVNFSAGELFFKFADFADDKEITKGVAAQLFVFSVNSLYKNKNTRVRSGVCYLVRKGEGVEIARNLEDAIKIDGLAHEDVAAIFSRCEIFYSYDEASMYSCYAAMCGCLSVVIPKSYSSREAWVAQNPHLQYGVAYGENDLDHARLTQSEVVKYFQSLERSSLESVHRFIATTRDRFG